MTGTVNTYPCGWLAVCLIALLLVALGWILIKGAQITDDYLSESQHGAEDFEPAAKPDQPEPDQ